MNKVFISAFALTAAAGVGAAEVRAESAAPGGPVELSATQLEGITAGQRRVVLRNVRQDARVRANVDIDGNRNTVTISATNTITINQNGADPATRPVTPMPTGT